MGEGENKSLITSNLAIIDIKDNKDIPKEDGFLTLLGHSKSLRQDYPEIDNNIFVKHYKVPNRQGTLLSIDLKGLSESDESLLNNKLMTPLFNNLISEMLNVVQILKISKDNIIEVPDSDRQGYLDTKDRFLNNSEALNIFVKNIETGKKLAEKYEDNIQELNELISYKDELLELN